MPKRDKALAAFGRNVAKVRTERGLSQDQLAEQASLDRSYVSGIEPCQERRPLQFRTVLNATVLLYDDRE